MRAKKPEKFPSEETLLRYQAALVFLPEKLATIGNVAAVLECNIRQVTRTLSGVRKAKGLGKTHYFRELRRSLISKGGHEFWNNQVIESGLHNRPLPEMVLTKKANVKMPGRAEMLAAIKQANSHRSLARILGCSQPVISAKGINNGKPTGWLMRTFGTTDLQAIKANPNLGLAAETIAEGQSISVAENAPAQ